MSFNEEKSSLDRSVIITAMQLAAERGWRGFTLADIAFTAGLPLEDVRKNYPCKSLILVRLNGLIDETMLCGTNSSSSVREGLFDLFMRRFDALQDYREGVTSVMRILPFDPPLGALLGVATLNTIKWIADAAGLDRQGISGKIRLQALLLIWAQTLRNWERDNTIDLTNTMQALDAALNRAERFNLLKPVKYPSTDIIQEPAEGLPDYNPE